MAAVSGPGFGRKCEYYSDNAAAAHIVSAMSETILRHTSYCHRNEVVSKLREKFNKYFLPRDECGPKIKQFVAEARRQRQHHSPASCLIINWCGPTKKFTENLQEHEFMLGLRCRDGDVCSSLLLFTRFSSVATFTCPERSRGQPGGRRY